MAKGLEVNTLISSICTFNNSISFSLTSVLVLFFPMPDISTTVSSWLSIDLYKVVNAVTFSLSTAISLSIVEVSTTTCSLASIASS